MFADKPCVVKQQNNTGIWFVYVTTIPACNLIKVLRRYFNNLEPAYGGFDHIYSGQTNIILNSSAAHLLLYYRLIIFIYQVHMHWIPRFWLYNVLRWHMSINSPYIFELLTYVAQLSKQFCLRDKDFPITYL